MRKGVLGVCGVAALLLASTSPAFAVSKNVEHVNTLPEGKWATAINFLPYGKKNDVMMVTGRFGLKSYSLRDPANPKLLTIPTSRPRHTARDPPESKAGAARAPAGFRALGAAAAARGAAGP